MKRTLLFPKTLLDNALGHQPVGTLGLAIDAVGNQNRPDPIAVFGFFDSIDDRTVSDALLDHTIAWVRSRNIKILREPLLS